MAWYDSFEIPTGIAGGAPRTALNWNPSGPDASGNPFKSGTQEYAQFAQSKAGPAGVTGTPSAVSGSAASAGADAAQQIRDMLAKQKADQQAIIDRMRGFVSGSEPLPTLYNRLSTEAGIPTLQAQLQPLQQESLTVQDQLRKLPGDVATITAGEGEARRRLVEASKQKPLVEQLADLSTAQERIATQLASATQGVGTQAQLYSEQFTRELDQYKTELGAFSDQAAREATGFTNAIQLQLDAILQDIRDANDFKNKLTLQQQEYALKAAQAEKDWINTKEQIQMNFQNDLKKLSYEKSLSGSGGGKVTVGSVKDDIGNIINSIPNTVAGTPTTKPGDAASNYLWQLQNKQPGLFDKSGWDQLWSYVMGLGANPPVKQK